MTVLQVWETAPNTAIYLGKLLREMLEKLRKILQERILILDGAMGTMIQRHELGEEEYAGHIHDHTCSLKGNNDILTLTQPELIKEIHCKFLEAGSDIIETNTFNSTGVSQADYETENLVYKLNYESAKLAKEACLDFNTKDKPRFIAGALGPTSKTASISPDVNNPGYSCLLYTSPSPRDKRQSRMPSSA